MKLLDRWCRYAAGMMPRVGELLLGSEPACALCTRRIGYPGARATRSTRAESSPLDAVIRPLSGLLCASCLTNIPWIRDIQCTVCGRAEDCPDCIRRRSPRLVMNRAAVLYDAQMKGWLAAYKYQGHERLLSVLSLMLDYAYLKLRHDLTSEESSFITSSGVSFRPLVTSVPISDRRMQERGFNQAERLATVLADRHRLSYVPLLRRIRHTTRQSHKSRLERMMDMQGAFAVASGLIPDSGNGHHAIVIVDDVYTTGSTLHECARVLHAEFGIPIYGVTWAR